MFPGLFALVGYAFMLAAWPAGSSVRKSVPLWHFFGLWRGLYLVVRFAFPSCLSTVAATCLCSHFWVLVLAWRFDLWVDVPGPSKLLASVFNGPRFWCLSTSHVGLSWLWFYPNSSSFSVSWAVGQFWCITPFCQVLALF